MKIVYVDEQVEARTEFERIVLLSEQFEAITAIDPSIQLEATISEIEDEKPDALITDFRLHEHKAGITYSGKDLVDAYLKRHGDFPCFITTSYPRQAADASTERVDVNLIFSKEEAAEDMAAPEDEKKLPFLVRVHKKIEIFRTSIDDKENRMLALLTKAQHEPLSLEEFQELVRIDSELESQIGEHTKIPDAVKELAIGPVAELVSKAQDAISRIEKLFPPNAMEN